MLLYLSVCASVSCAAMLEDRCLAFANNTDSSGGQRIRSCAPSAASCLPMPATQTDCCTNCTPSVGCVAWIFKPSDGSCWLMASGGTAVSGASDRVLGSQATPAPTRYPTTHVPARQTHAPTYLTCCDNSCTSTLYGTCSDGGVGANASQCALGTDCRHCGPGNRSRLEPAGDDWVNIHCACHTVSYGCDNDAMCIYDSNKATCQYWEKPWMGSGIAVAIFWPVVLAICAKSSRTKLKSIFAVAALTFVISILYLAVVIASVAHCEAKFTFGFSFALTAAVFIGLPVSCMCNSCWDDMTDVDHYVKTTTWSNGSTTVEKEFPLVCDPTSQMHARCPSFPLRKGVVSLVVLLHAHTRVPGHCVQSLMSMPLRACFALGACTRAMTFVVASSGSVTDRGIGLCMRCCAGSISVLCVHFEMAVYIRCGDA